MLSVRRATKYLLYPPQQYVMNSKSIYYSVLNIALKPCVFSNWQYCSDPAICSMRTKSSVFIKLLSLEQLLQLSIHVSQEGQSVHTVPQYTHRCGLVPSTETDDGEFESKGDFCAHLITWISGLGCMWLSLQPLFIDACISYIGKVWLNYCVWAGE